MILADMFLLCDFSIPNCGCFMNSGNLTTDNNVISIVDPHPPLRSRPLKSS